MKMGSRQSKNVLDLKNPDDLRKHEAQTAIAYAEAEREARYKYNPLYKKTPMSHQTTNGSYTWYNNNTKEGFKRLTRSTGVPAGKLKK